MKMLFSGRHGSYDLHGNLASIGAQQMEQVAQAVQQATADGLQIFLLCSTAQRAMQGGKILMEKLNISKDNAVFAECLWVDDTHDGNWQERQRLVEEHLQEGTLLVVLSHHNVAQEVARLAANMIGVTGNNIKDASYGGGWFVSPAGVTRFVP